MAAKWRQSPHVTIIMQVVRKPIHTPIGYWRGVGRLGFEPRTLGLKVVEAQCCSMLSGMILERSVLGCDRVLYLESYLVVARVRKSVNKMSTRRERLRFPRGTGDGSPCLLVTPPWQILVRVALLSFWLPGDALSARRKRIKSRMRYRIAPSRPTGCVGSYAKPSVCDTSVPFRRFSRKPM